MRLNPNLRILTFLAILAAFGARPALALPVSQGVPLDGTYGFSLGGSNVVQLVDVPGAAMSGTMDVSEASSTGFLVSGTFTLNNQGTLCTMSFSGSGTPDTSNVPSGTMVWGSLALLSGDSNCLLAGFPPPQSKLTSINLVYSLAGAGELLNLSVAALVSILQLPNPTIFYLADADTNFISGVGTASQESLIGLGVLP